MTSQHDIGWIGLGKMGVPICKRLAAAGHRVTALVRNEAGAVRASDIGIASVRSARELTDRTSVIFAAVPDDEALADLVMGPGQLALALTAEHVFIESSTVSPAISTQLATLLTERGTAYLRAPVSGSTATAEAGQLTVLVSGPEATFNVLRPVFQCYAAKQFYLGAAEQARYMKLAVNAMVGATAALVAEATHYGLAGGLDMPTMVEVICNSAVSSPLIQYKRQKLETGDYAPAFTVSQMLKDLDLVLDSGNPAALPMTDMVRAMLEAARRNGDGEEDFFVLARNFDSVLPPQK
jgi:3-hydroxyisobutyrate dehydrogenase-like beta-hydroxyacid dehydrogenase